MRACENADKGKIEKPIEKLISLTFACLNVDIFSSQFATQHAIINDNADDNQKSAINKSVLGVGNTLADNEDEEGNESHIHSINRTRNMGSWSTLLTIQDLPSIDPLQEANIVLSLNVSTNSKTPVTYLLST